MRCWLFLLIMLLSATAASADEAALQQARERWLHGNYAEARDQYAHLLQQPMSKAAAAVGLSRCWRSVGDYEKGLTVLAGALKEMAANADLLAERADLLYSLGRWEEAGKDARDAISRNSGQFLAHWVLARYYQDSGAVAKADAELLWFIRVYSQRSNAGQDITDPEILTLVGLAALERARKDPRLVDQYQFVLSDVWGLAARQDKNYWPALYQRGLVFQEKYDAQNAFAAFTKALQINPRAVEVLTAKGVEALSRFQMTAADLFAEQALTINPHYPAALCLRADIFLAADDIEQARHFLDKALQVNPRSEETLARLAACHYLQGQKEQLTELLNRVEKQNPKASHFYYRLGELLDGRKRYEAAEKYFKKSVLLQPQQAAARNELGLLYLRLGKEGLAKEILDIAFERDPFNVRVYNSLKVLDHLKEYATHTTKHFRIRFDPKNDAVLVRVMAKYLEDIYEELARDFQYRPQDPILIEIFNNHAMFSGRVIALPDLHTIGASTGKIIALVSPHDKSGAITRPFNWNRVLRHELVHVFNLEQTHFLVPHWFTEGLAVRAENTPMPPQWSKLLLQRVPDGELMNLDNIHLGFIRPRSPDEWHMAYLQSRQYVEYLSKTFGEKAVAGLLAAYGEGLDTGVAIEKVCRISKAEFEKGYRQYLEKLTKTIAGNVPQKEPSFRELKDRFAREPSNPDVLAGLARQYLFLGNRDKAQELTDRALAKNPAQPRALYVQARLKLAKDNQPEALELLRQALDKKHPDLEVVQLLGKLRFEAKKYAAAAEIYELGYEAQPYDSQWLVQLIRCYRQTEDQDKLIDALKKLVPTDTDDLTNRRELAQLLLKANRPAEAETYAREALEINVMDDAARTVLREALQAQNKDDEWQQWERLLEGE